MMIWLTLVLAITPVYAGDHDFPAERVLSAASGDWDGNGSSDLALLVAPVDEDEDLTLYLYRQDEGHPLLRLSTVARNIAWGNHDLEGMFGRDATLEALPNGSIAVHSEQTAVSRNKWQQTITVAWRDNRFVVAGFTYSSYDTLDPDAGTQCDYNVLTGAFVLNGQQGRRDARILPVEQWEKSGVPAVCEIG